MNIIVQPDENKEQFSPNCRWALALFVNIFALTFVPVAQPQISLIAAV